MSRPQLTAHAAVLLVKDVAAAAEYYRAQLGFDCDQPYGESSGFCILHRDFCYLMLRKVDDPNQVVPHGTVLEKTSNVYFWVSDAEALYCEFVERGAKIAYGLGDKAYGCREFGVQDLDGYHISFGQVIESPVAT